MRHKGVRPPRRRATVARPPLLIGTAAATAAVAGLGYLVAFSAVAGWVLAALGAAVALRPWRWS